MPSATIIIVVLLLILVLGGGYGAGWYHGAGFGLYAGGFLTLALIVILVLAVLGKL